MPPVPNIGQINCTPIRLWNEHCQHSPECCNCVIMYFCISILSSPLDWVNVRTPICSSNVCLCCSAYLSASDANTGGSAIASSMELLKSYLGTCLGICSGKKTALRYVSCILKTQMKNEECSVIFVSCVIIAFSTETSWFSWISLSLLRSRSVRKFFFQCKPLTL